MFTPPGVTADQYHAALLSNYQTETEFSILTLNHEPVAEMTPRHLSGQINWLGRGSAVSRTMQVELLDPGHELELDDRSPRDGAMYPTRLLAARHTIISPLLPTPATVPLICGPLVMYRRNGDTLSLEIQSKEQRLNTDHSRVVCRKNMRVVDAIERFLRACGETRFAFPGNVRDKLPKDVTIGREENQWPARVVEKLARSIGYQLFPRGDDVWVLREPPKEPVFDFAAPTSLMRREHDWTQVYNRVEVRGRKKIHVARTADQPPFRGHPFSPENMAANGKPWERTLFYSDDKIANKRQATNVAKRELGRVLMQRVELEFNHLPVWHLDTEDPCTVNGRDRFAFDRASAAIGSGDMTVGTTRRVARPS